VGVSAFGGWLRSGTAAVRRRRERSGAARHPAPALMTQDDVCLALRHALRDLCDLALRGDPPLADLAAFDAAVRRVAAAMPLPVQVTVEAVPPAPAAASTAYAVICEALANVVGHARARRAIVTVRRHGPTVQLSVSDDGDGGAQPVIGGGIVVLAARVAALGGLLHVDSPAGSGTHVTVELPFRA
jgi:signal transduction histidine kinase